MKVFFVLVVCALYAKTEAALAPFVTPCHSSDAACHKSSAQKVLPLIAAGIPSLDIQPLDPLHIARVQADQAGVKIEFRNTIVKGLRNCIVLSLRRQGRKQNLDLKCSPTLIGDYTLSGKLLILPVEGNGKYKIKIRDIVVKVQYEVNERTAGDTKFWKLTSWKFNTDVLTGVEFQFQNLFNGNKQLSDTVHNFANANWHSIFQEVAPPIVKAIVTRIVEEVSKFFDHVPKMELAID